MNISLGQEKLEYSERVVFFIDILGFKSFVGGGKNSNDAIDVLYEKDLNNAETRSCFDIYEILKKLQDYFLHEFKKTTSLQFSQFSDSIVVSYETADVHAPKFQYLNLFSFNLKIADLIIHHGVLLRGAVSVGELYHEDNLIFGPAFIDAYNLESRIAKYPRIIFSEKLYEGKTADEYLETNDLHLLCSKDSCDDRIYIDYFKKNLGVVNNIYDEGEYIKKLHDIIQKELQKATDKQDSNLIKKYEWAKERFEESFETKIKSEFIWPYQS